MEKTSSSTGRWQTLSAYVLIPLMILAACVLTRNSMLQRKAANSPSVLLSCGDLAARCCEFVSCTTDVQNSEPPKALQTFLELQSRGICGYMFMCASQTQLRYIQINLLTN